MTTKIISTKEEVGLIVGDLLNPYGKLVHETLQEALRAESIGLRVASITHGRSLSALTDQWFQDSTFRGLIVGVASSLENDAAIDRLGFEQGRRVVVIGTEHSQVDSVSADFEEGGFLATKHLIELGHERVAFIGANFSDATRLSRLRGYLTALKDLGKQVVPDLVVPGSVGKTGAFATEDGGRTAALNLMKRPHPPTAIFARNDYTAIGVLRGLAAMGVRVPQDVSVVGFDGIDKGMSTSPPLTSVVQPTVAQARVAAEYLLYRIHNRHTHIPPRRTVMGCRLMLRASTGRCPPAPK